MFSSQFLFFQKIGKVPQPISLGGCLFPLAFTWWCYFVCICGVLQRHLSEVTGGDTIIVKTEQGHQMATVLGTPGALDNPEEIIEMERFANQGDTERSERNREKEQEAMQWCRERARELDLAMKLISVPKSVWTEPSRKVHPIPPKHCNTVPSTRLHTCTVG